MKGGKRHHQPFQPGKPAFIVFLQKILKILKTENSKALKTLMFNMGVQGPDALGHIYEIFSFW